MCSFKMSFLCVTPVCESKATISSNFFNYGLSVSSLVSTGYWFPVAIFAGLLRRQMLNSSAS